MVLLLSERAKEIKDFKVKLDVFDDLVAVLHLKTLPYFVLLYFCLRSLDPYLEFVLSALWAISIPNIDVYFGVNKICKNID